MEIGVLQNEHQLLTKLFFIGVPQLIAKKYYQLFFSSMRLIGE